MLRKLACSMSITNVSALTLVAWLLLWRFWTFTVIPLLFPRRPKTLPYWIPYLKISKGVGHTVTFVRSADRLLEYGRLYFGNSRKPFAIVLGGQTVYVVTSDQDVTSTFRNVEDLGFHDFVKDLLIRSGLSAQVVQSIFDRPAVNSTFFKLHPHGDWRGKPVSYFSERIIRTQLMSREALQPFQTVVLAQLYKRLDFDAIPNDVIVSGEEDEKIVSLHAWVRHTLLEAMTVGMYGESFLRMDSLFLDTFRRFDSDSWKLTFRIPSMFGRSMLAEKRRLEQTFDRYYALPADQRSDACWMIKALEAEMRAEGHSARDVGTYLLLLYWVINSNAWKAAFWIVSRILCDPSLRAAIGEELHHILAADIDITSNLLQEQLDHCPILMAAWHETMRTATSSISAREVLNECTIGDLHFQPGTRVIIPSRQTLIDANVFGAEPESFNEKRFLNNPCLHKSPSFRPFGGGISYCPGRVMAKKEVIGFTIALFKKFDISLLYEKQKIPKMDTAKPCLGIMDVVDGEDLLLRVRKSVA